MRCVSQLAKYAKSESWYKQAVFIYISEDL